MKTISVLSDEMKSNFNFIGYFRNVKEMNSVDNEFKVGDACILREIKRVKLFRKIVYKNLLVFDGTEWCLYDVENKIFETDNFDTVAEFPHPSGKGLLVILHNTNWEVDDEPYFLVFSTEGDRPYSSKNSRRCRIFAHKPEYLIGYNENCKLSKAEKELFLEAMDKEWETQIEYENNWNEFFHKSENDTKKPDYSSLETEE